MSDQNIEEEKTIKLERWREYRVSISLIALVGIIAPIYYTGVFFNQRYVDWHDNRYAKKSEVISKAEAAKMKEVTDRNAETLRGVGAKVDTLAHEFKIYAAVAVVSNLKAQFDQLMRERDDSISWQRSRDTLARQIEDAEAYKDCVLSGIQSCHQLRTH